MQSSSNFIDGKISPTKSYFPVINRFTDTPSWQISDSEVLDLIKCIQPAQNAFKEWKSSNLEDRLKLADHFHDAFQKLQIELVKATANDLSLPMTFINRAEFKTSNEQITLLKEELIQSNLTAHEPIGPIAFILSAQFPLRQFSKLVLPALLAGNSVIIKPSILSANFQKMFVQILDELKLPAGLIQVISGTQSTFKNFFVSHPGIKALCVVGSHETLVSIQKTMQPSFAQTYKPIKFLGGAKNSAVVLSEFDENLAKNVLESFLFGQGQLHWNSTRLFILEKHKAQWHDYIDHVFKNLKTSEGIEDPSMWTPLLRPDSHRKYNSIIKMAKDDQAKLLSAKETTKPHFVSPIFTEDMSNCSTLQQDQVAAPLFILSTVKYPFDVPKYANVSYYGDTASIWIDPGKGEKVIAELAVANIVLNRWAIDEVRLQPGIKQSSFGNVDHSIFGTFHTKTKSVF